MNLKLMIPLLVLVGSPPLDGKRVIVGGTPKVRTALMQVGVGAADWESAEMWVEPKVIVWVSKAPWSCDADVLQAARIDPDFWHHGLRVLDVMLPKDEELARIFKQQRLLLIEEGPSGTSCGWRVLEPGTDWESVPLMKVSRTIGNCGDALDALKKMDVGVAAQAAVRATLQKPRSLSECSAVGNQ